MCIVLFNAYCGVGTALTCPTERGATSQGHLGQSRTCNLQQFLGQGKVAVESGVWCPGSLLIGSVTCSPSGSGSPLMGGSSCLPVMTRLSSCGTRPAGSVSTHTVSMAGESSSAGALALGTDLGARRPSGLHGLELWRAAAMPLLLFSWCLLHELRIFSCVDGKFTLIFIPQIIGMLYPEAM